MKRIAKRKKLREKRKALFITDETLKV